MLINKWQQSKGSSIKRVGSDCTTVFCSLTYSDCIAAFGAEVVSKALLMLDDEDSDELLQVVNERALINSDFLPIDFVRIKWQLCWVQKSVVISYPDYRKLNFMKRSEFHFVFFLIKGFI